jgi:hypothetical protein
MGKQKVVVRFLKATGWNARLAGFITAFEKRREELNFALQVNTSTTVNFIKSQ